MLQKIMLIIFPIWMICKRVSFLKVELSSTSIIKITVKEMAISPECFVCFRWGLQNWREQSFNLTIGTEGITQLLKSNFEQSKYKWRHQCHTFAKKENFFLNMSFVLVLLFILFYCWLSVLCQCCQCLLAAYYSFAIITLWLFMFLFSLTECVPNLSYSHCYLVMI